MKRMTWRALALAAALASPHLAAAKARPPEGTRKAADVYVLGSSSIGGRLGRDVARLFSDEDLKVYRFGRRSTGFARPDYFDWWAEVDKMPGLAEARVAVFYMGVNDTFAVWLRPGEREGGRKGPKWVSPHDDRWAEVYRDRVASLVQKLCDKGVAQVALLTPMDVADESRQGRLGPIREAQAAAAAQTSCGVAIATDGDIRAIKSSESQRNALRTADGNHATGKGTRLIMSRIRKKLLATLEAPAPEAPVGDVALDAQVVGALASTQPPAPLVAGAFVAAMHAEGPLEAPEPAALKPAALEPAALEPAAVEPVAVEAEPAAVEAGAVEPTTAEPTAAEPTAAEPTGEAPLWDAEDVPPGMAPPPSLKEQTGA